MLIWVGLFFLDVDGNLVNVVGYYLNGFLYDGDGNFLGVDWSFFVLMEVVNVGIVIFVVDVIMLIDVFGNVLS